MYISLWRRLYEKLAYLSRYLPYAEEIAAKTSSNGLHFIS